MSKKPSCFDRESLVWQLDAGSIVPLAEDNWNDLASSFKTVEEISTEMSGSILLIRRPLPAGGRRLGWALVEEPEPKIRVVRPLADEKEARALIADRLAAYERMWDG
ncbi:MAG: hypothetical protein KOO60_12160 [Gemmatimonadales bacterium]|nr:hypothetical protein [Gemmatimonadales bacterium]